MRGKLYTIDEHATRINRFNAWFKPQQDQALKQAVIDRLAVSVRRYLEAAGFKPTYSVQRPVDLGPYRASVPAWHLYRNIYLLADGPYDIDDQSPDPSLYDAETESLVRNLEARDQNQVLDGLASLLLPDEYSAFIRRESAARRWFDILG